MEVEFEKPKIKPLFQAEIYRAMQDGKEVYRVVIGREGTAVPPKEGEFIDYHEISDFMDRKGIEDWVNEQVGELERSDQRVEFDKNLSYVISRAVDELATETQARKQIKSYFSFLWN